MAGGARSVPARRLNHSEYEARRAQIGCLTQEQNENNVLHMFQRVTEATMLKTFVEEAAALASIVLFVGMIAVWAQLIPQL